MPIFKIKNWEKYQHYKNRNPTWIKFHISFLTSPTWVLLDDASRVLAIASMLLAARENSDGTFTCNTEYIKKVANLNSEPNFEKLIATGFLEVIASDENDDASTLLATCYQDASVDASTSLSLEEKRREEKRRDISSNEDIFCHRAASKKLDKCPYEKIWQLFHKYCVPPLPEVICLSATRKTHIRTAWKNELQTIEDWEMFFKKIAASDFLLGKISTNGNYFKCNFDWIIKKSNLIKILESNYDNRR